MNDKKAILHRLAKLEEQYQHSDVPIYVILTAEANGWRITETMQDGKPATKMVHSLSEYHIPDGYSGVVLANLISDEQRGELDNLERLVYDREQEITFLII